MGRATLDRDASKMAAVGAYLLSRPA